MPERQNPYHETDTGQFAEGPGGTGGGSDKSSKGSAGTKLKTEGKVPRGGSDLRWKSEDTITGSVVIEVPDNMDLSQIDHADVKDFIKEHLPGKIGSIDSGDDIEDVKVTKMEKGKGYVRVDLDITPSTKAGEHWLDTGDAAGQWSTYHGGRSMNTVQEVWNKIREIFEPLLVEPPTVQRPYGAYKRDNQWCVYKNEGGKPSGESLGCHDTEESANEQIKAILASTHARSDENSIWITREQMRELCPNCADEMEKQNLSKVNLAQLRQMPAGLVQGLCKSLGNDPGLFTKCMAKDFGEFDPGNKEGFCAWLHHECTGTYPGEHRMIVLPTQTRAFTITRDSQGNARWLMIAASAVINKVGAIDSTVLFDNFIKHANEMREYPVLDFFHEGEQIRFGVADWLKRDGALYLASGTFDDTDLARSAASGLETQPDYWGGSIAYHPTEPPLVLMSEGEIPVYMDGINRFISIVPKRLAANLFTATLVAEEVKRMNATAYEELVKLVGEERAKQFADQVDAANRTIADTGMMVRADAPPAPSDTPPATPADDMQMKMDKMQAMMEMMDARLKKLEESYGAGMEESTRAQKRATDELSSLITRLAEVETIKARWQAWVDDAPEYVKVEADKIYRARNQEPAPMTMEQLAAENVAKLSKGPHQRHQG